MRSKSRAHTWIALIALVATAPGIEQMANAQAFRGGGGRVGGGDGGFRPQGGYGGGGFTPGGAGLGFGLPGPSGGDPGVAPVYVAPPRPTPTPTGERPPRRHPRPIVVAAPPTYGDEPDDPVEAPAHPHRPPRLAERPRVRPTPQPALVYAKPPVLTRPPKPPAIAFAPRVALPVAGETRFRTGEVLVEIPLTIPEARIADVLRRHRLTQVEVVSVDLLRLSLRRWRAADTRTATAIVSELGAEAALVRIQPNYLYTPADDPKPAATPAQPSPPAEAAPHPAAAGEPVQATLSAAQYALIKMKVEPSLESADSSPIRVAVIDTAIDDAHPDLKGVVEQSYDAIGDGSPVRSKDHGTAMAGGIAADGRLRGVATHVKILSARAFDTDGAGGALGSTLSIVKALDWSAREKAQVVNMSFAGPNDPTLHDALAAAIGRGIALIGAAGNAGPTAPPQYPGADANVIAATATDADDKVFPGANTGAYVAISAPGVDVLLPAPDGGYAMESGTSVSSALVAGVVALMLERKPDLKPTEIRQRLTATATPLGGADGRRVFGAGLVDASKAVAR